MSYFHFTLGPVQSFVAQARRTRDFWAGSFVLSWLSAVAMTAVKKQRGEIAFPIPDQAFMDAIERGREGPKQGNIPNRFMAKVGDGFRPEDVVDAVRKSWKALADKVWEEDLKDMAYQSIANGKTRKIWDRQISAFWDIEWALVDEKDATDTLERLKNWRSHLQPEEPGVKCMMMDGWQEISGADRPGRKKDDPEGPDNFWNTVRESGRPGMATDLRPKEMLCAIAFVKRRFVRHFENFKLDMPGGWAVHGWELPYSVPSVHYMAVAPWLAQLLGKASEDTDSGRGVRKSLVEFHKLALSLTDGTHNEWRTNIRCVREADGKQEWKALDGTVFFDAMLENENLWDASQQKIAAEVLVKLKELRKTAKLASPSPFYAVLLMDGDELGSQMSDAGKQQAIANGLAQFTGDVSGIVHEHNGFLVYAGGDDVLALLPLEHALNCAAALRKHYMACFPTSAVSTSISAAIEYAHVKMPLGKVLGDAHDLLDSVAKEGRGRDAVACRVWKPGGKAVEWAQPWEVALKDCSVVVELLAEDFRNNLQEEEAEGEPGRFASKFFYRIGERFDLLNPRMDRDGNWDASILTDVEATDLMAMEYLNSGKTQAGSMEEARKVVLPLLDQCRPRIRVKSKPKSEWESSEGLKADGALLVRFLAQKGAER